MSNLRSYALWAAVAAFVLLVLQDFHVAVDAASYNQLVTAFLGVLVLGHIISGPSQGARPLLAKHLAVGGTVIKSYSLWVSVLACILLGLQTAHVPISAMQYNQAAALFLQVLVLAGIINSPGAGQAVLTRQDGTWNSAKDLQAMPDPPAVAHDSE